MRKSTAIAIEGFVAAACLLCLTAAFPGGAVESDPLSARIGLATSSYHPWTDQDYLHRRTFTAREASGCALLFRGDSSAVYILALRDSIFAGTGGFVDSTATIGQRVALSFYVDPESVGVARMGYWATRAEVQALASAPGVEIVSTSGSDQFLGWRGIVDGARVAGAGETGMSRELMLALFQSYQDSAAAWGIGSFRSHRWRGERYQIGSGDLLRQRGYYQAFRQAQNTQTLQADADTTEGYAEDQPNHWRFGQLLMGRGGFDNYSGLHTMGEGVSDWNLGLRRWRITNGAHADSVTGFLDMGCHSFSCAGFVHDGAVRDSASTNDMNWASLRTIVLHAAHREAEGRATSRTVEGLAAVKRGIRVGEVCPHDNWTVLSPSTVYTNGGIASTLSSTPGTGFGGPCKVPLGWSQSSQHYNGTGDMWADLGTDVATTTRQVVYNLAADGDSITASYQAAYGNTDSLSAGLGSLDGNVVMHRMFSTTRSRPFAFYFVTVGHQSPALEISGQFIYHGTMTANADTLYVAWETQQVGERWDDFLNEGPSGAQGGMEWLTYAAAPDTGTVSGLPDSLIQKQSIVLHSLPSVLAMSDTSFTTGFMPRLSSASTRWTRDIQWRNPWRLFPNIRSLLDATKPFQSTIGNARPSATLHAIERTEISGHETVLAHMKPATQQGRIYTFRIVVDLDEKVTAVPGYVAIQYLAASGVSAHSIIWLDIGARLL